MNAHRIRYIGRLGCFSLVFFAYPALAQDCPDGNLLEGRPPLSAHSIANPVKLTDGWATVDSAAYDHPDSSLWRTAAASVTWTLGRDLPVSALEIQADGNDKYAVSTSTDGVRFDALWTAEPVSTPGLATRNFSSEAPRTARFIRLEATEGDNVYAATELRAFCRPEGFRGNPLRVRQNTPLPPGVKAQVSANSGQLVVLVLGSLLAFGALARKFVSRFKVLVALLLIAASGFAWTHFLAFHGKGDLHVGDAFHYFMGPKYYASTGYFDLYRCVAQAERELGHGSDYTNAVVRDLDDNRVWHGTWFSTEAGKCRATFSPAKWQDFKKDVSSFRTLIQEQGTVARLLVDHGFNATPFHATFLRAFVLHLDASTTTLRLLAQLDTLAMIGAIVALWWGFGPLAAALFAVVLGTGSFWGYQWLGGTIARHVWLFWMALGLAAAHRRKTGLATVALTLAGLHRLYPLFFLAAYLLWHVVRTLRSRRWLPTLKRSLTAGALTLAFALTATVVSVGPRAFVDYAHVIQRHAGTPGGNRLGFPLLLATHPGGFASNLMDSRLTDPSEVWVRQVRDLSRAHWPLRSLAVLLSGLLIFRVARRGSPREILLATGPLLYALQDITSYDFIWLTLYAVIAIHRVRFRYWYVGYVALTVVLGLIIPDIELQHYVGNWALFALLSVIAVDLWQRPRTDTHRAFA